jgi:hypothetical protein
MFVSRRMAVVLLSLCCLLLVGSILTGQGTKPAVQVKRPMITAQVANQPKIIMERVALESAAGMKIYKTKVLAIRPEILNKLGTERNLTLQPAGQTNAIGGRRFVERGSNVVRLTVDDQKGHMHLLSNIERLAKIRPQLLDKSNALRMAQNHVNALQLISKDVSQVAAGQVVTLGRADVKPGQQPVTGDILQTVVFQRNLDGKPVVGTGSVLFVDLGDKGQLEGFGRAWQEANPSNLKVEPLSQNEVYNEIEKTLKLNIRGGVEVRVKKPRLIYSDDDRNYIQPAYFFTAEITSPNAAGKAYWAGVVSALKNPPEPVRLLRDAKLRLIPGAAPATRAEGANAGQSGAAADDPSIGRYVVRNDSWDWVDDSCDFLSGVQHGHHAGLPAISVGDYYWDEPRMWTTQENSFADRWHVNIMEGHGSNWLFTTRSNCCDTVNLNAGTQPGYGNRAGDSMRFLILKGCSIVPAPPDRANWPDPWWRIFKGLRQAVGFRTSMYINDNISHHFGEHVGDNCRVIDSWFHATNSDSGYQWERFWGSWGDQVYGYGAVVYIPGHAGDGIYSTGAAPAATSTGLSITWQH